ncbi:MAG: RHS repeat-associated core domain-containing protein [Desulfovibrionaceae bacterium]
MGQCGYVRFGLRDYDPFTGRFTAKDPLGYAAGDPDLYGYCLDDPVNAVDPWGLDADCISGELNAAGFGMKGELGGGVCWDDDGALRLMGHADAGASTGWGAGGTGTWQTTNADKVDDVGGWSFINGISQAVAPGPWKSKVTFGADKIHADKYDGEAYSVGLGWGNPTTTDVHTQVQRTWLLGNKEK